MERQISLNDISDGKLYTLNDMVKADCQDCEGCSACCRGMGSSIVLDPMDIYRLSAGLHQTFEEMLASGSVELNVVDGVVLPNLKMSGDEERCQFLDEAGRCGIHPHRPGICRLFPLGRVYEDGSFRYFLQIHECKKDNRTKVKVKKWLDTPNAARYERYITDWQYHLKYMKINRIQRSVIERQLGKTGVYRSQHQILMFVADSPNVSQKEIAAKYGVSTATIAVSLKKLEKGGYIRRIVDEKDNRFNQICITEKGRKVVDDSVKTFTRIENRMFEGFSEEEFKSLEQLLDKVFRNLEKELNQMTESEGL